ncbi:hypothetical protein Tco_0956441 [Tanacetum coccineum]
MLDNIPFEIQEEIMKRLPIKPLLRFRSKKNLRAKISLCSDDDNFPPPIKEITANVPTSVTQFYKPEILGSSQGLFCLYYSPREPRDFGTRTAVIWNPTIKKSIAIDVPVLLDSKKKFYTYVGFGFKESLAVIHLNYEVDPTVWDVWMMENGDPESFRKIYTIKSDRRDDDSIVWLFGSRKSGEPLVEVRKCFGMEKEDYALFVYNPNSEQNDYIGISAKQPSFVASAYTETLLLLDR